MRAASRSASARVAASGFARVAASGFAQGVRPRSALTPLRAAVARRCVAASASGRESAFARTFSASASRRREEEEDEEEGDYDEEYADDEALKFDPHLKAIDEEMVDDRKHAREIFFPDDHKLREALLQEKKNQIVIEAAVKQLTPLMAKELVKDPKIEQAPIGLKHQGADFNAAEHDAKYAETASPWLLLWNLPRSAKSGDVTLALRRLQAELSLPSAAVKDVKLLKNPIIHDPVGVALVRLSSGDDTVKLAMALAARSSALDKAAQSAESIVGAVTRAPTEPVPQSYTRPRTESFKLSFREDDHNVTGGHFDVDWIRQLKEFSSQAASTTPAPEVLQTDYTVHENKNIPFALLDNSTAGTAARYPLPSSVAAKLEGSFVSLVQHAGLHHYLLPKERELHESGAFVPNDANPAWIKRQQDAAQLAIGEKEPMAHADVGPELEHFASKVSGKGGRGVMERRRDSADGLFKQADEDSDRLDAEMQDGVEQGLTRSDEMMTGENGWTNDPNFPVGTTVETSRSALKYSDLSDPANMNKIFRDQKRDPNIDLFLPEYESDEENFMNQNEGVPRERPPPAEEKITFQNPAARSGSAQVQIADIEPVIPEMDMSREDTFAFDDGSTMGDGSKKRQRQSQQGPKKYLEGSLPQVRYRKVNPDGWAAGWGARKSSRAVCIVREVEARTKTQQHRADLSEGPVPEGLPVSELGSQQIEGAPFGTLTINSLPIGDYFRDQMNWQSRENVMLPFAVTGSIGRFDVRLRLFGGGLHGQAQAAKLAIARALQNSDPLLRPALKASGCLSRDPRIVERKKPGQTKARRKHQWVRR